MSAESPESQEAKETGSVEQEAKESPESQAAKLSTSAKESEGEDAPVALEMMDASQGGFAARLAARRPASLLRLEMETVGLGTGMTGEGKKM